MRHSTRRPEPQVTQPLEGDAVTPTGIFFLACLELERCSRRAEAARLSDRLGCALGLPIWDRGALAERARRALQKRQVQRRPAISSRRIYTRVYLAFTRLGMPASRSPYMELLRVALRLSRQDARELEQHVHERMQLDEPRENPRSPCLSRPAPAVPLPTLLDLSCFGAPVSSAA